MPILTKAPITKGTPAVFTLDKAALALLAPVVADSYFSDSAKWKHVSLTFKSSTSNQNKVLLVDVSTSQTTVDFKTSVGCDNIFQISNITLHDFDGGSLLLGRSVLPFSLMDIDMTPTINVLLEQLVNNSAYFGALNRNNVVGQKFNYLSPLTITRIELPLKKSDGFPVSGPTEYRVRIKKTSDNSILGVSTNSMIHSSLTSSFEFTGFDFSPVAITSDWYFEIYNFVDGDQQERFSVGLQRPVVDGGSFFSGLGDVTDANLTYKIYG